MYYLFDSGGSTGMPPLMGSNSQIPTAPSDPTQPHPDPTQPPSYQEVMQDQQYKA